MTTYYRFFIEGTQEILEFDTEKVTFATAERKVRAWAKDAHSIYEYLGIFEHKKIF